jgi:protein CpxP
MSMKFAPVAAAVLALAGFAAQAQPSPPAAAGSAPHMQERMHERMQRRMEGFKKILQITPAQEGAWNAWASAMKPSAQVMQDHRKQREELARMTTPERIDRMRQLRVERNAQMDKRFDATKTFYAQLSAPQQKAFDEASLRFLARHGRGGDRGGHRGHHLGA